MADIPKINGIPLFGLGTFPLTGSDCETAVRMAIDLGIRHIDTAQMYGNEADVGRAIKACGVPRSELYIVTKVDPGNVGKERFADTVARSMEDLGGPADLLLIHWPPEGAEFDAALDRLMAEKQKGMARSVGISNFTPTMMRRAQTRTGGALINNQVEFHPLLDQRDVLATANELGVALSAYSPLARGAALRPPVIQEIARRIGRPPSEVVLRWIVQQGVIAIPMTTKRDNAISNLRIFDFELSDADMAAISALGTRQGRTINPSWMAGRWDD
ncbi:MAG: aldo/keto reductase [Alphaproteobacteria bacterium]|nr:aldo/keto reductase [Alphaproteobacteria bacterium]